MQVRVGEGQRRRELWVEDDGERDQDGESGMGTDRVHRLDLC